MNSAAGTKRLPVVITKGSPVNLTGRMVGVAILAALFLWYLPGRSAGIVDQVQVGMMFAIGAMALNLVLGYTGLISIGHSAFFGVGAYTTGVLVSKYGWGPGYTFLVAFVIAFAVGALVSLPALRIKGVYLALVTLALAVVFPKVVNWNKLEWLTGGPAGLQNTGYPRGFRSFEVLGVVEIGVRGREEKAVFFYWMTLVMLAITFLVCRGIINSRAGRSLIAIRDNERAAAVMGVNLAVTKAIVFGISAGLCSLAGSVSAIKTGNVDPLEISLILSITYLIVMIVGGAGTLWGPIVGAAVYKTIFYFTSDWGDDNQVPGVIKPLIGWVKTSPVDGIFAVILIILMFVAPRGIVGFWKQHISRLVRIVPAGVPGAAPSVAPATVDITTNPEGETS